MISIVMPVAYDFRYAFGAIARVYSLADEIVIGLDCERISWSGRPYAFDDTAFAAGLAAVDPEGKIRVIEDDFHTEEHPMANDTRERNMLSTYCRPGNWVLQIDCDEYLLNPADFKVWLAKANAELDVQARWITVFKTFGETCLVAQEPNHRITIGTRLRGAYRHCRTTSRAAVLSNLQMLHYSWGRSREELALKLANWSHSRDFDTDRFLAFWDGVTLENYMQFTNFHPLHPPLWAKFVAVKLPPVFERAA
jgi:hypothetical protein